MFRKTLSGLVLALATTAATAETRVLCLGDSLTEGYGVAREEAFPALIEAQLKAKGVKDVTVVNAGVSGATSASGLSRLKWHLKAPAKPAVLVLSLGANDGLRGIDPAATKSNLTEVIDFAKANGMKVLLTGMSMPPNMGRAYIERFEATFKEVAKTEHVALMPFLLEGVGGEAKLNLADGVHPNERGHEMIAKRLMAYLEPLLSR